MSLNLYELALNSAPYFARLGATIDGAEVTTLAHPDNDPTDNWAPFGDTDNMLPIMGTEADDSFLVYDPVSNTHIAVEQEIPNAQGFEFTTRETNNLADELMFGLAGPVVQGASVIAHALRAAKAVWPARFLIKDINHFYYCKINDNMTMKALFY